MTKSIKKVSVLVCLVLLAAILVACNPKDKNGGSQENNLTGATIYAVVDNTATDAGESIEVSARQDQTLKLYANVPASPNNDAWKIERQWLDSTTPVEETSTTYTPDISSRRGEIIVVVQTRYTLGDQTTNWSVATAKITVSEAPEVVAPEPTDVKMNYQGQSSVSLPVDLGLAEEVGNLSLTYQNDRQEVEYSWAVNGETVPDNNTAEFALDSTKAGTYTITGGVRNKATDTTQASKWVFANAFVNVHGIKVEPQNPEVWVNYDQPFTARLEDSTDQVSWVWSIESMAGSSTDGFSIDPEDGILVLDKQNTPKHGTKIYVVATTVLNDGMLVSGRTMATVRDPDQPVEPPVDPELPQLSNATMGLVSGGIEGTDVTPAQSISFSAYQNQDIVLNVGFDKPATGTTVEIKTVVDGVESAWGSNTKLELNYPNLTNGTPNNPYALVRASKVMDGQTVYTDEVRVEAFITVIQEDTNPPVNPDAPEAPTGVMFKWAYGGVESNNQITPSDNIYITAYQNQEFGLDVLHDQLPQGTSIEMTSVIWGTQNPSWTTDLGLKYTFSEASNPQDPRDVYAWVRTFNIVDGVKQVSKTVVIKATITVIPLPAMQDPTNVAIATTGLAQAGSNYTVKVGATFNTTIAFDKQDGVDYEIFWSYRGNGVANQESVDWAAKNKPDTAIKEMTVKVRAVLYNQAGKLINSSQWVQVSIWITVVA